MARRAAKTVQGESDSLSIEGDPQVGKPVTSEVRPVGNPAIEQHTRLALAMTLLAGLLFSTQDAAVKWLAAHHHVLMLLFVRSLVVAAGFLLLLPAPPGRSRLAVLWSGPSLGLLWVRSALGCLAWGVYFFAVAALPLAALTTLMFTMPLFVALLAGPLLGETVGVRRALPIGLGFVGVLVMLRPGGGLFDAVALLGLLAALCYALMMLATRALSRTVSSATMVLHLALTLVLVSALSLPWTWSTPSPAHLLLMLGVGGVVGVAQFSLAQAYRHGAAALVAPFDYARLLWASAFGYWLWGDAPGGSVLVGASFVIGSGLLLLADERWRVRH